LEKLGAHRLAELLMEQADADPALARSLRLALAETEGTGRLGAEVEKRLRGDNQGGIARRSGWMTPGSAGGRA
jgi:hypothetical protein